MSSSAIIYEQDGKWYFGGGSAGEFRVQFTPDKPKTVKPSVAEGIKQPLFIASYRPPQTVIQFAQAMQASTPGGLDPISQLLSNTNAPPFLTTQTPDAVMQETINILQANEMMLQDAVIWQGQTLEDFIETAVDEVGEVLLEALVIAPMAAVVKSLYPTLRSLTQQKFIKSESLARFHTLFFADSPDFSITYHNFSGKDWTRFDSTYNEDFMQRAVSTAGPVLKGNAAQETLALSVKAADVALGNHENISVGYKSPDQVPDFAWIDVKIVVPHQFLHAGYSPYYELRHASKPDFYRPSNTPADSVEVKEGAYTIKVTPNAGGTSFAASVSITKTPKN